MLLIIGAASMLIWLFVFIIGLLFSDRKFMFLMYLIFYGIFSYMAWYAYNAPPTEQHSGPLLGIMIGILATGGLFMWFIGETDWEQIKDPWGPKVKPWHKVLTYACAIFFIVAFIFGFEIL